ncbi:sensor histidine kinase [Paraburkholderia franconis]|uniref:sensor histidine kinase n=1 Tax=Paraburkholderia franconis TaxID=2654983 RepID=UPI001D103724|nr:HAMP domain-containing sensor histidine kinase [Paraburkholderia franconis]
MLCEAVRRYAQQTRRIGDLFAGVLAHDLRSPLGAILNSAQLLLHDEGLSSTSLRAAANVQRGSMRMKEMIDDLLIFTRGRLGDVLPVSFASQDMKHTCSDAVDKVRASYPNAVIRLRLAGDLRGTWDGTRIGQLVVNLPVNGVRYGSGEVALESVGHDGQVTMVVSSEGNPIPERALPTLFDPMTRASLPNREGTAAGMGLGLYICRCITTAHHGTIGVESTEHGTSVTVRIPSSPSISD